MLNPQQYELPNFIQEYKVQGDPKQCKQDAEDSTSGSAGAQVPIAYAGKEQGVKSKIFVACPPPLERWTSIFYKKLDKKVTAPKGSFL